MSRESELRNRRPRELAREQARQERVAREAEGREQDLLANMDPEDREDQS